MEAKHLKAENIGQSKWLEAQNERLDDVD